MIESDHSWTTIGLFVDNYRTFRLAIPLIEPIHRFSNQGKSGADVLYFHLDKAKGTDCSFDPYLSWTTSVPFHKNRSKKL